jgi:hypothetical protein
MPILPTENNISRIRIPGCSNDYLDVDQTETISTKDIASI